jgi:hypothetical protein
VKCDQHSDPPLPSAPEIVATVPAIFITVPVDGADAGMINGGGWGWNVDMAALGAVHRFEL